MSVVDTLLDAYTEETVVLCDARGTWTRSDLQARVLQWHARLALPAGYVVALYADNCADWIAIDIACMEAGLVLVPLPTFFSDHQLAHILRSVNPAIVLSDSPQRTDRLVMTSSRVAGDTAISIARNDKTAPVVCPAGTAKITFTSGSTGFPKGVCLSATHLLEQAKRLVSRTGLEGTRHLSVLPFSTLLENVAGIYAPMLSGGQIHISSAQRLGFSGSSSVDPDIFSSTISETRPQTIILTPQLLQLLVLVCVNGWRVPDSLRFVAVGGSRVALQLLASARAVGLPAYEGYGLSECGSVVSLNAPTADRPGTTGKVLDGLTVTIEDDEVIVSGSAMLGYLEDPASWNPVRIRTGDIGMLDDDGFLQITGRRKNLLISTYGRNISPEWVESELLQNPALLDAIVLGDGRPYCIALISCRQARIDQSSVSAWLEKVNSGLPDYARIRRWLLIPPLATLPDLLTANGRPRRNAIADYFKNETDTLYDSRDESSCAVA